MNDFPVNDSLAYHMEQLKRALSGCIYTACAPILIPILKTLTRWINAINHK